ncbi:YjbH domain-containing protein [Chachezhania antarctica]|uniref:YjbH domain-containing protein n=1 Tax=Chachezhania antarctica TaxID=2340860 RepID=UPI001F08DE53|nr:YjbH domain-containing protein [Chachezhania antarctica]
MSAEEPIWKNPTFNFMGVPGMVDMPSAHPMPDGELSIVAGGFENTVRTTLSFQFSPRLTASFRYALLQGFSVQRPSYYDRSFDVRYLLSEEGLYNPAITVGLQDIGGSGIYSGEYLVGTKTFGRLRATAGIGWGRFGSYNGFSNPLGIFGNYFKNRPGQRQSGVDQTGRLDTGKWFRGDAALFGGVEYQYSDRLRFSLEYSSDAYVAESRNMDFERNSPFNVGVNYQLNDSVDLRAGYLYGSTVAAQLSYVFDPKNPNAYPSGLEGAPPPLRVRGEQTAEQLGWTAEQLQPHNLHISLAEAMQQQGLQFESFRLDGNVAYVKFRNGREYYTAAAVGRVSRIMTQLMPDSVSRFVIIPVTDYGLPVSSITIERSDLEELEFEPDGSWDSFARAVFDDAYDTTSVLSFPNDIYPAFDWGFGPYLTLVFFDPNNPLRYQVGLQANATYEFSPGTIVYGRLDGRLAGNEDGLPPSNSQLPRVRTDVDLYAQEAADITLANLFGAKYFRPGQDLFGRVSAGYLEMMYGGISAEVLWKPVDSAFGVGAEINYVKQRAFDQLFGFQDYEIATGHVSFYNESRGGYLYQLDVGRYLAGDWGATFSLAREFDNGIRIGAYATLTDVPFDEFGEGSFDKGITIEIPFTQVFGRQNDREFYREIRPVLRDGGARLNVPGRLYHEVREKQQPILQEQWGRFWR